MRDSQEQSGSFPWLCLIISSELTAVISAAWGYPKSLQVDTNSLLREVQPHHIHPPTVPPASHTLEDQVQSILLKGAKKGRVIHHGHSPSSYSSPCPFCSCRLGLLPVLHCWCENLLPCNTCHLALLCYTWLPHQILLG